MSRTRWPISASAAPRLTAVVVLPTPPFCMATAIVRAKSVPSLTEARRDRPHPIIGRGVRGQAVPHPPEDVSGGLGSGPGHVRGGGRIRDGRTAGGLVGCDLQGVLPLRRPAERRLARNRLAPPA